MLGSPPELVQQKVGFLETARPGHGLGLFRWGVDFCIRKTYYRCRRSVGILWFRRGILFQTDMSGKHPFLIMSMQSVQYFSFANRGTMSLLYFIRMNTAVFYPVQLMRCLALCPIMYLVCVFLSSSFGHSILLTCFAFFLMRLIVVLVFHLFIYLCFLILINLHWFIYVFFSN